MQFSVFLGLMGGLALFLYGMQMTSTGLEHEKYFGEAYI